MADYIERQAALRAVNEFFHDPKVDIAFNAVPAANVREDVQGEWIPYYEIHDVLHDDCVISGERVFVGFKCSVCGRLERNEEPFCNCGARMTGGSER